MRLITLKVNEVAIGERVRKELGDLTSLENSIRAHGLLSPIVVNRDKKLIAGFRRLSACKRLGFLEVPAVVVDTADNLAEIDMESQENLCRKTLTDVELDKLIRMKKRYLEPGAIVKVQSGWKKMLDKVTSTVKSITKI